MTFWAALALWLHLLAAIFWVGGQLFLVLVVIPVLRRELPEVDRVRVVARAGRRFAPLAGVALVVLLITGPINAAIHGVSPRVLRDTAWGHVLIAKAAMVVVVLALTGVHGAYFGRRLEQLGTISGQDAAAAALRRRLQRLSIRLSAANLALNLIVVALAAWLAALP